MNGLQRENAMIRESLEKEKASNVTLKLQLESKNQFISSFTASTAPALNPIAVSSSGYSSTSGSQYSLEQATTVVQQQQQQHQKFHLLNKVA